MIGSYNVLLRLGEGATDIERSLALSLLRKLEDTPWLNEHYPQGFLITDDENDPECGTRQCAVMVPVEEVPTEDLLERKFEFRFPATQEAIQVRDELEAAFAPDPTQPDKDVFVTIPSTIVDPYTKKLVEVGLLISVARRPSAL